MCAFGLEHPLALRDVSFVQQIVRACGCKLQKYISACDGKQLLKSS